MRIHERAMKQQTKHTQKAKKKKKIVNNGLRFNAGEKYNVM